MAFKFDVAQAILLFIVMYLFVKLSYVEQIKKDIINTVVIILIIIFAFWLGWR